MRQRTSRKVKRRKTMSKDKPPPDNVVQLHDRITVTFSREVSRLIRQEIERQRRERPHRIQTPLELAEEMVRSLCEAMATDWIEVRR
jgi:hypothetical protein